MNPSRDPNYWTSAPPARKRVRVSGCFLRVLAVLLILGGIYLWWAYKPTGRAADLAPAIADFTNDPEMIVKQTDTEPTSYGFVKQYSGTLANGDQAYFDVDENGAVANFLRAEQPNGEVRISMEDARTTAFDFAAERYSELVWLEEAQLSETLTGADGSTNRFYSFRWIQQDPQSGAILPQMLTIQVNAQTGQVDRCSMLNEPVTISTLPSITKQAATQAALSALPETPRFDVVEVLLTVTTVPLYEPNGEQALVWSITVTAKPDETGYVAGGVIFIDAQTGEVLLVDPFA